MLGDLLGRQGVSVATVFWSVLFGECFDASKLPEGSANRRGDLLLLLGMISLELILGFRGFGGVSFLHPSEEVTEEAAASKSCLGIFSAGSFMLADNAVLPRKLPCPLKKLLGRRLFSFWNGSFFGDMLIFRGVTPKDICPQWMRMMLVADLICIKSLRTFPLAAASVIAGRAVAQALQPRNVWPEECEQLGRGISTADIHHKCTNFRDETIWGRILPIQKLAAWRTKHATFLALFRNPGFVQSILFATPVGSQVQSWCLQDLWHYEHGCFSLFIDEHHPRIDITFVFIPI